MSESFPGDRSIKKISPVGPEFKAEQKRRAKEMKNRVYGSQILVHHRGTILAEKMPAELREMIKGNYEKYLNREAAKLDTGFKHFLSSQNSRIRSAAVGFIHRGLWGALGPENVRPALQVVSVVDRIKSGKSLAPPIWVRIVQGNELVISQLQKTVQKEFPAVRTAFRESLPEFLADYHISEPVVRTVTKRLTGTQVRVVDGLSARVEAIGGFYSPGTHTIFVAAHYVNENTKQQLTEIEEHELFHAISGRLVYEEATTERSELDDIQSTFTSHDDGRIGLHFMPPYFLDNNTQRFRWLNEAVTERLRIEYAKKRNSPLTYNTYLNEQKILEFLCKKGKREIPFEIFVRAYLEDYKPAVRKADSIIREWRHLRSTLNESFTPQFLVSLDNRIKQIGVEKVLMELEGRASER
ncbi:MAG: hypothetical protein UY63_C0004G0055 [Parcubacteria group bacterium GW2011_GWA2_51_10]|nr:MAG: hypothetical protein UY63_C0004G0055 [Parcubacteria group bacterium GW2011_GWA2_51_10]